MSNVFFTADTHFYHKRILEFCSQTRPFKTVEEMNEGLIEAWNKKIEKNDTVYHLGDVSFGKAEQTAEILDRLNGQIFLIRGNHDGQFDGALRKKLVWCDYYKTLPIKTFGHHIVLCHFPIESWDRMHHGSLHLFGHLHSGYGSHEAVRDIPRRMDVGIDSRLDYSPWAWEEIKEKLNVN